jgi:drug/metabolite transporter (DMT)-like permease
MDTDFKKYIPVVYAITAALLFGLNAPFSKLLVKEINPLFLAALLYLGAGIGMLIIDTIKKYQNYTSLEARLTKKEMPFVIAMILLDIAAPIFLMFGLTMTNAGTASLLGNFEIVATSIIAMVFFQEALGKRLWIAIALISIASVILTLRDVETIKISVGALLVLLSAVCWGFENNCTRNLSIKDPLQVVIIKGFGSGIGALFIAYRWGELSAPLLYILLALILGFFAYGLSIFFYVTAQRELGAARTSAYYAAAPFMGVVISWIILREPISATFLIALAIMIAGTYFAVSEKHIHEHTHKSVIHEHKHKHDDAHHDHTHNTNVTEHSHEHTHRKTTHTHEHLPDLHHRHKH